MVGQQVENNMSKINYENIISNFYPQVVIQICKLFNFEK